MDRIPVEVLRLILEFLPASQLNECLRVCKKWQFTIECLVELDCLVVYKTRVPVNQRFFHSNRRVSLLQCIHIDDVDPSTEFKKRIYRKFKRIYFFESLHGAFKHRFRPLTCLLNQGFFFNQTPQWTFLANWQQLNEVHLRAIKLKGDCKLVLPNLKVFRVGEIFGIFGAVLILDAPQLTHLSIFSFDGRIALVHPETIETLRIIYFLFFQVRDCRFLASMSGLRSLVLQSYRYALTEYVQNLEEHFVNVFLWGSLKEIHFCAIMLVELKTEKWRGFYSLMRRLKKLPNELRIYFGGLEIDHLHNLPNPPKPWIYTASLLYKYQLDCYLGDPSMHSETLPFLQVGYDCVQKCFGSTLFLHKKLANLETVAVGKVRDELALGQWLKSLETVTAIYFGKKCRFSTEFYSCILPASLPNLECIRLYQNEEPFDCSFLLKFKFLFTAHLKSREPNYGLVEQLFSDLVHLKYLFFLKYDGQTYRKTLDVLNLNVKLDPNPNNKEYTVYWFEGENEQDTRRVFQSFEDLIQFTKQLT